MSRFCGRLYAEWVREIILESGFGGRSRAVDGEGEEMCELMSIEWVSKKWAVQSNLQDGMKCLC